MVTLVRVCPLLQDETNTTTIRTSSVGVEEDVGGEDDDDDDVGDGRRWKCVLNP